MNGMTQAQLEDAAKKLSEALAGETELVSAPTIWDAAASCIERLRATAATAGEIISRGFLSCPQCQANRSVSQGGQVAACVNCSESGWWNVSVSLH